MIHRLNIIFFLTLSFLFSEELYKYFKDDSENSIIKLETNNLDVISFIDELNLNYNSEIDIPSYSTFYQIHDGYDIQVSFNGSKRLLEESIIINDLNNALNIIDELQYFPENNLVISEPMIFRGIVVKQVTFYPFQINLKTNQIYVFEDVQFDIEEYETDEIQTYNDMKLSRLFEPLYQDLIVNYESSDRNDDYQKPSILYICGGSSMNNSYVQELIEWGHKRGYIVNAISTVTGPIRSPASQEFTRSI